MTTILVIGTVDDPSAGITVNGSPATVESGSFRAGGIRLVLGANTITATAVDALGNNASVSITVYLDLTESNKIPRFTISVHGTVDDPTATVSVNRIAAANTGGQFSAPVLLMSGYNVLTATATDAVGNAGADSIRVFVPWSTQYPPRPTVGTYGTPIPRVTKQSSLSIGGTKTAGTAIWINGRESLPISNSKAWTVTLTGLIEGDNEFSIFARDFAGLESAEAKITIVLDKASPVVIFNPPTKTNLSPVLLEGSVDDSLTTVSINMIPAVRTGRIFQVSVPLPITGPYALHLIAQSPNGYTTEQDYVIKKGTIPILQSIVPITGSKLYADTATNIRIMATDQEGDPMQYQLSLDGIPLSEWSNAQIQSWRPSLIQLGPHTLRAAVRDAYGGSNTKDSKVFVLRSPVQHP